MQNCCRSSCPQALARIFMKSELELKKRSRRFAASSTISRARIPKHPIAWMAEFDKAIASAPRPLRSKWCLARAKAGVVGTDMLSTRKIKAIYYPLVTVVF